ncbi:MAG: DUF3656 domain-containing protein [Synechococcales cyanobacterium]
MHPPALNSPVCECAVKHQSGIPLLLAPAGNWECARAAVANGADAIYFGLERFNARMRAENFTVADLGDLMPWLHQQGVKGYVTLNTLVFPGELAEAEHFLKAMISAGVDAVIVQDVGICRLIRHLSPDFPIHASTQMTITSSAGVAFAQHLGASVAVLARECSLRDMAKIQGLPLEVFVHGALCVAYSGQCLTSEALGGRSANRGECAQACRMAYDLIADGIPVPLGDRRYLLSPQDLMGLERIPELVAAGVHCLKIEGRLKSPDYVAAVTRIYRQALDRVAQGSPQPMTPQEHPQEHYELGMSFSRGLWSGWLDGINNQRLVDGRYGKKRGVYLGTVSRIQGESLWVEAAVPVKAGDGIVVGLGDQQEQGGRVYQVRTQGSLVAITLGRDSLDLNRIRIGDPLWKTSDPDLEKRWRQSYQQPPTLGRDPLHLRVEGSIGQPLTLLAWDEQGHTVAVTSSVVLQVAQRQPLTPERLREQLGRLGGTPFRLGSLENHLAEGVILPVSELNQLRRQAITALLAQRARPHPWILQVQASYRDLLPPPEPQGDPGPPTLSVLIRSLEVLPTVLAAGVDRIYLDLEDPRQYRRAVEQAHAQGQALWVAPPRISKPGEQWILKQVKQSQADGYLVRNYDHLEFFADQPCVADFSLNIANPLTASHFWEQFDLERLTASYDLNVAQLGDLLQTSPAHWYELTLHQHMPMFHMEHCVFCAFLSEGTDHTNCGRPCETHQVTLRDRTGTEHILRADAGCRNTLYHGQAQTGAEFFHQLWRWGARHFRVEFVAESPVQIAQTVRAYQGLLAGTTSGSQLWRELQLLSQLGVTRGQL